MSCVRGAAGAPRFTYIRPAISAPPSYVASPPAIWALTASAIAMLLAITPITLSPRDSAWVFIAPTRSTKSCTTGLPGTTKSTSMPAWCSRPIDRPAAELHPSTADSAATSIPPTAEVAAATVSTSQLVPNRSDCPGPIGACSVQRGAWSEFSHAAATAPNSPPASVTASKPLTSVAAWKSCSASLVGWSTTPVIDSGLPSESPKPRKLSLCWALAAAAGSPGIMASSPVEE